MRLALAPLSAKTNPAQTPEAVPPGAPTENAPPSSVLTEAGGELVAEEASETSQAALDASSAKTAMQPRPEQMSNEERMFLEGLEAARRHAQRDQFTRALRELSRIQPLHKKYPARTSEFEFLYAISLAFTEGDSRQTLRALQMLDALRNAYKTNPDYWRASGFANQLLGMDETQPTSERRKFLRRAKSDYTESLRLGRDNPKYTQARSYIEHIERDLKELVNDNAGD
jgi:hypothetical protein